MLCFVIGAWADTYTVAGAVLGGDGSESAEFFFSKWEPNESQNDMEEAEGVFVNLETTVLAQVVHPAGNRLRIAIR